MAVPTQRYGSRGKDPDLYTESGNGKEQNPPLGGAKRKTPSVKWQSQSVEASNEEENPSFEDVPDGFGKGLLGEKLRPENLLDLRGGGSKEKDPLERRLEATVNSIFQRRKVEESRNIASDYGISEGDSFSIQCWGDKQCAVPATCLTTFLCRWVCCCCSSCVSKSTEYEKLDKFLISKECTTSYEDITEELKVYAPSWLVKLFLLIQNPHFTSTTMLSREEVLELKQAFFNTPHIPWIGVSSLLEAVNIMRIATEAANILYEKQIIDPPWKHWPLYRRRQNAVEQVSECKFFGENLTLELVASWLLCLPTGNEDFSSKGVMRRIYAMLCATLAANMTLTPDMELEPIMVLGVLLSILKEHGVVLTPKDNLIKLAFDCNVGKAFPEISIEMQRRSLALLRRALNSRHFYWWDYFNNTKEEAPLPEIEEEDSSCCVGCSPCCKRQEEQTQQEEEISLSAIVKQPLSVSSLSLNTRTQSLRSQLQRQSRPGLGYKLQLLHGESKSPLMRPTDEDGGQVSSGSEDD